MALARNISARQAATYYEKDDYYTRDHSPSEWHGSGARALGLEGAVGRQVFAELVEGRIPNGPSLHHGGGPRRAGTDFEFSAPKSFSIQALVNNDTRLIDVHKSAVAVARERIEATVATRVTEHRETRIEFTRSAVIAQFEHATSRAGDPDMHSHVVVLNVTRRADGQWRSIENAEMFKEQRLMYEIYLSELAKGAKDLGYEISMGKHGNPELAHITREQIEHFSQRSREVVAALESEGLSRETSTAAQKRAAALATREAKQEYDQQALRAEWIGRGRQIGLREYVPSERRQLEPNAESEASSRSVQFAVEHLSEREAVFTQRAALIEALRASRGDASTRSVAAELDRRVQSGELLQDGVGQRLTTPRALEAERQLLAVEAQGRDKVIPILSDADVERPVLSGLNTGQRSVVELILMTPNRIVGVNGLAGTGKTTALTTARNLATQHGFEFVGLAPSHSAVRALKHAGVKSQTVQRWLMDRGSAAKLGPKSVVVLDEASLAGTATLRVVLERVEKAGARAVLVGDVYQYQSVEAGRGFAQLQQNGMQTAQLTEMVRQRNARLAEAARASVHAPARSLELLPIVEDERAEFRHQHIAESFASASPEARTQTLVLTGTHEARRDINARIRAELKLAGSGELIDVFRRLENTAAERKALHTYHPGLTIRFEKSYRSLGVQRGDTVKVERVFADSIVVSLPDGTRRAMAPQRLSGKGWSVGTVDSLEVAAGERVRFTGTDPAGFKNGERGIVEEITPGRVAVRREDHQVVYVSRDRPASLDYSYAVTGHSAQGLDADRVILEKDTRSLTTNHRSFYTDVTRAREVAVVVTDSAQRLAQVAATGTLKSAAMDIAAAAPGSAQSLERGE